MYRKHLDKKMASMKRLELLTVRLEGGCSIQLSYMDTKSMLSFFIYNFNWIHQIFVLFSISFLIRNIALNTTIISILPKNIPMVATQRTNLGA